jgi:hypothetical protein
MNAKKQIKDIVLKGTNGERKALFVFNKNTSDEKVLLKFNLWARYFQTKYFTNNDAFFHKEIDSYNLSAYRGKIKSFTDIGFRGCAKTARTKLFIAYCIANDQDHFRKYIKVLAEDVVNSKQIVTDIYNMFIQPKFLEIYPEIFEKGINKREETMLSFTTATGIKLKSGTVGTSQRGALQEEARPDIVWFEDFENKETIRSAVKTKAIWDNMEEARTSLAVGGACIYTCNYISESANVNKLVEKKSEQNIVLITPIMDNNGVIAWDRYSKEDIEQMKRDDDNFEGERLCSPSASRDIYFSREKLNEMKVLIPVREIAGFKIFKDYIAGHRYGSGHDVAGGVGLDSSTSVFIDFSVVPAEVVATFASNTVKPEVFGYEIKRQSEKYDFPITAIENNKYDTVIQIAKQEGLNLYKTERKAKDENSEPLHTYGWETNALTKPRMLGMLATAIDDGLLVLNDENLILEAKKFSRNDSMERDIDPRLATRHFDLLIACAIAWQMKNQTFTTTKKKKKTYIAQTIYG